MSEAGLQKQLPAVNLEEGPLDREARVDSEREGVQLQIMVGNKAAVKLQAGAVCESEELPECLGCAIPLQHRRLWLSPIAQPRSFVETAHRLGHCQVRFPTGHERCESGDASESADRACGSVIAQRASIPAEHVPVIRRRSILDHAPESVSHRLPVRELHDVFVESEQEGRDVIHRQTPCLIRLQRKYLAIGQRQKQSQIWQKQGLDVVDAW
eukprot:3425574-Rhodomonas_salina.1